VRRQELKLVICDVNFEQQKTDEDLNENLKKLLHGLPPEQKEVLIMKFYHEMSFKDIAEDTGVSINTSLGRMRYAIVNFKKLAEQYQVDLTINQS
jgi:RNA polymerase sigma-70 factor (ECF subfamily)